MDQDTANRLSALRSDLARKKHVAQDRLSGLTTRMQEQPVAQQERPPLRHFLNNLRANNFQAPVPDGYAALGQLSPPAVGPQSGKDHGIG